MSTIILRNLGKRLTMSKNRSLYCCLNAKVDDDHIYCSKGHKLNASGDVNIRRSARGEPLEFGVCQRCLDFLSCGGAIPKAERGWQALSKESGEKDR